MTMNTTNATMVKSTTVPQEVADAEVEGRDLPLAPVALRHDRVDERHDQIGDQRAHDLAERAADDDGDREIDDVALVDELSELFQD